jgi:hypothetical protein
LIAGAAGHGIGWHRLNPDAEQPTADINLSPEQVLRVKLIDLQGQPIGGVKVTVATLGKSVRGDWDGVSVEGTRPWPVVWPAPVVTDAAGRCVFRGVSRDRGVGLRVEDNRFATLYLELGQTGSAVAEEVTFSLAPAKTLEGEVHYEDTGRPVQGAQVLGQESDATGQFRDPVTGGVLQRLAADSEDRFLSLAVTPPAGTPYLGWNDWVTWPKGAQRHSIDIKLVRGVVVRGRVTDAVTGAPISGAGVQCSPQRSNNSNFRSGATNGGAESDANGAFELVTLPGPCHLLAQAPTPGYIRQEVTEGMIRSGRPHGRRLYPNTVVRLEVPNPDYS